MFTLGNAELNKLKNVECTLEKSLKSILERVDDKDQHFGPELLASFEDTEKTRVQEIDALKQGIRNIVLSLRSKLDLLKDNKIGDIKDFKKFKQEMVDIQENILNMKIAAKTELKTLAQLKEDVNDELNIYYNGKVAEWSEPLTVNMSCEFIPPRVKSKNTGQCKEVRQFFDFVHQSGGQENGWRKDDHLLFVKFMTKYKEADIVALHLHEVLPDISIEEIKSHVNWYKKYLCLKSKKKEAINRWKQNKNSKNSNKSVREDDMCNKHSVKCQEDGTRLREKLILWKIEKDDKLFREREIEKQRLLDKIEKERLEKQRQIDIKNVVSEWKESKVLFEQTKKQDKRMYDEMEKKRRSALANKLIKQFQSMDELYILKMRQAHKKLTDEPPKRVKSGPPALRDPQRLMQPTIQWAHRVRSIRDPISGPLPLYAAPKLAIPDWRKSIR